jgi:hypothetical protein
MQTNSPRTPNRDFFWRRAAQTPNPASSAFERGYRLRPTAVVDCPAPFGHLKNGCSWRSSSAPLCRPPTLGVQTTFDSALAVGHDFGVNLFTRYAFFVPIAAFNHASLRTSTSELTGGEKKWDGSSIADSVVRLAVNAIFQLSSTRISARRKASVRFALSDHRLRLRSERSALHAERAQ